MSLPRSKAAPAKDGDEVSLDDSESEASEGGDEEGENKEGGSDDSNPFEEPDGDSTRKGQGKWDSYFDEVPPKQWRYLDFYQTRSLRPGFSRSFAKESSALKKSLENLLEHDSDTAKDSAIKLYTRFKNHRKKYGEVDLFWTAIEEEEAVRTKISAQQLSLELSKISSVKKVYDCASTYTEEVFETAADNLVRELCRHAATDVADKYISWEFDGEPPSWLSKAIKEYESSISEVEMR
ncbi:hypothetical protein BC938DRAFT_479043 [Jimgerdemannia flammicorona]|uniref:Uncharacterized protein n=1 Tax=Jimgerdemannia flammicorona TaxID=994334 RepID=A0A433QLS6_9FUNG|nr:hypothetical protein BC938DRAFT_479043 [Jimgerdemannia flammicorona]